MRSRARAAAPLLLAFSGAVVAAACGDAMGGASTSRDPHPIVQESDPQCTRVEGVIERIDCFADRAEAAGDLGPCDEAQRSAVRLQCYAIFAERLGDPDVCRRIPGESAEHQDLRDACLGDVAEGLGQPGPCEAIEAPGLRDSCYLAVFRRTGDASLCEPIEDAGLKSACTGEPVYVD